MDTPEVYEDSDDSKPIESTRSYLALIFVIAYVGIIVLVLLIGTCRDFTVNEYSDLLLAVSGILSGPLGFVVGHYFKSK